MTGALARATSRAAASQCRLTQVRIPDGVEDQSMRRQRAFWIEIVRNDDGCQEDAVVQKRRGRDVAAARGDQLQQGDRRRGSAIGQVRDGMAAKALLEMMPRGGAVADIRKHGAESLMRRRMFRIDLQHRFVMGARFGVPVGAKQQVGQIDMPDRIFGVMGDRLRIDAAGGLDRAHVRQQRSEFVERGKIRRRPPQDIDEGLLRVLVPVECAEQNRALDLGVDRGSPGGVTRQFVVELPQPGFLRQPGCPAAIGAGDSRRGRRVLLQSGHDAGIRSR